MMKRIFKILLGVLAILLVAVGAVWGSFYALALRLPVTPPPQEVTLERSQARGFGTPFPAQLNWRLPRWAQVEKIDVQPGNGTLLDGKPVVTYSCGTTARECHITVKLRGIRSGWSEVGQLQLEIAPRPGRDQAQRFTVTIPPVEIQPPSRDCALPRSTAELVAPELKPVPTPARWPWYLVSGLAVLAVLIGGIWWWKHRARVTELSLGERTLLRLHDLRSRLTSPNGELPAVLTALSDIVRDYLEKRYQIPASRKTTPEFLAALESDNPLPEAQRPFLRDFLRQSDLIKFAKAPVTVAPLQAALTSAEQLVETTREDAAISEVKHD